MLAITTAAALLVLVAGRHLTFFYDEWDFILGRRGESLSTYLDPHNGHLSLLPVIEYKFLLSIVGLRHYWPYRAVVVVLHTLCGWLLYVLARRRVGPWAALVPATALLFMGSAFEDLLWAFQSGFVGSVASGLGALLLLDVAPAAGSWRTAHASREVVRGQAPGAVAPRRRARADVGACALLACSLCCSSVGIPFVVAAVALLLTQRAEWRRAWVIAVPTVLYAAWYLGWGTSEQVTASSALAAPQYVADAAGAASAGIAGLSSNYGPPLIVATLAAILLAIRAKGTAPGPMLIAATAGALAFWVLAGVARADAAEPGASRYLYVGAAFMWLAAVDALAGVAPGRAAMAAAVVLLAGALIANVNLLREGERGFRSDDDAVRYALAAVQIAAPVVSPGFVAEPQTAPQIPAGPFLSAVRSFGSPALSMAQLEGEDEVTRAAADGILEQADGVTAVATTLPGARPPQVEGSAADTVVTRANCDEVTPTDQDNVFDLSAPAGQAVIVAPGAGTVTSLYLRRFASAFGESPFAQISARSVIRLPRDLAPALLWHARLTSSGRFAVCMAAQ